MGKEKRDKELKEKRRSWEREFEKEFKKNKIEYLTGSSTPVRKLYDPGDVDFDYAEDLGYPGEYPFTRGVYPTMYHGRFWTWRQFSGFGTSVDTNKRYKFLLGKGQTGLSVAFDFPTLYGYDSDAPQAEGEVGKCGVAISSLKDMERLFEGIPLDKISTSMTINGPAAILWAFYLGVGQKQGVSFEKLQGTIQNDILKEYQAQKSWIFPPRESMRVITDILAFATENVPKWNTISISGYHIREAGSTAVQELAFTLANGFAYVEAGIKAGLNVDSFAPRLSFFFNSHNDFFEEIAKFRAARRIWARRMREVYKAKNPVSWRLRFHTQTAGCTLTAQQPENNIIRTAFQGLSAVLGGTQSLHTNSMDETLALPTEKAAKIALRTQHLIAYESGVTKTIDPLAGSYYVEALTDQMEQEAEAYFKKIEDLGGVVAAIEKGFFQKEIAKAAFQYQKEIEEKKRIIVGVNEFIDREDLLGIEILKIDEQAALDQHARLKKLREERDSANVKKTLERLRNAAEGTENLIPSILDAAFSYATLGEITGVLREVFGEYKEPPLF